MYKMSYEVFKNPELTMKVFRGMVRVKFPKLSSSFKVKKLTKQLDEHWNLFSEQQREIKNICKWEELTKEQKEANAKPKLLNPEEIDTKIKELLEIEVEMSGAPLSKEEVTFLRPSAEELDVLKYISDPKVFSDQKA